MGYSTSSPQFSDKRKFPLYFRTSASDNLENPARIAVLKKFGWTRVALLVENYDIFVLVSRIGSTAHSTWLKNDTRCKAGGEKEIRNTRSCPIHLPHTYLASQFCVFYQHCMIRCKHITAVRHFVKRVHTFTPMQSTLRWLSSEKTTRQSSLLASKIQQEICL